MATRIFTFCLFCILSIINITSVNAANYVYYDTDFAINCNSIKDHKKYVLFDFIVEEEFIFRVKYHKKSNTTCLLKVFDTKNPKISKKLKGDDRLCSKEADYSLRDCLYQCDYYTKNLKRKNETKSNMAEIIYILYNFGQSISPVLWEIFGIVVGILNSSY